MKRALPPVSPIPGTRVQATDNVVTFVPAWIAMATILTVCAGGCRQADVLGPGGSSVAVDRPPSLPAVPQGTVPAQVVEVCRLPTDEAGEGRSTAPNEIADETAPVNGNLTEVPRRNVASPLGVFDETSPLNCNLTAGTAAIKSLSCGDCAQLPANFGDVTKAFAEFASEPVDPSAGQAPSCGGAEDHGFKSRCGAILVKTRDNVFRDYANYYTRETLVEFVVILAPAAVFANSDWDADVGDWYEHHVRSAATNRAASFFRPLGNGFYTIPAYVSAKFLGEYFDDQPGMELLGEFGDRATRALLVGGPPLLALQYLTGGGRPSNFEDESYWRPFRGSHGASGHAFIGAVPFLTLAGMTDDPLAKCFFYACSPWTGITRINDNVHYLSQVWLGWWMAYLGCDAVDKTEKGKGPLMITPVCTPEMTGVGLIYQY